MELFLELFIEDPLVFCLYHFESPLAIGAEDQISGFFIPIQWNFGLTDRTYQFSRHELPPAVLLEIFLFDILSKIKTIFFSFVVSSLIIE
jgi:hypothetical protein